MTEKLEAEPNADLTPYKVFYLERIYDRALNYDSIAYEVTGRKADHVLLLHQNLLNSSFLYYLLEMFKNKNRIVLNASDAHSDTIYDELPDILPAGESIIWALAKQTRRFDNELRYPSEDSEYEKEKMDKLGL